MKIVVDTNVIVSSLINAYGNPAKVMSLILNGKAEIVYDNRILEEYFMVLNRKHFSFLKKDINHLINFFKDNGDYVLAEPIKRKFIDEDDKKFYEVLETARANYLITGNLKHYPKEKRIITPQKLIGDFR